MIVEPGETQAYQQVTHGQQELHEQASEATERISKVLIIKNLFYHGLDDNNQGLPNAHQENECGEGDYKLDSAAHGNLIRPHLHLL